MEQDPVKVAPHVYQVLLENEWVRVLDANLKKGSESPMHWHPERIIYTLSDGKVKVDFLDGSTRTSEVKAGVARWTEPMSHSSENLGDTDVHSIIVELKSLRK